MAAQHAPDEPTGADVPARFPRAARLKRRRLIRPLFDRKRQDVGTVAFGCIRLLYRVVPREETGEDVPVQIGFAPGRCPTSVARNRIRRIMREVYRVHQHTLIDLFLQPDASSGAPSGRPQSLTVMALFRGRPDDAGACLPRDFPEALRRLGGAVRRRRLRG